MRQAIQNLEESKIREVANAGMGRSDVLAFWFGESDEVTPDFIRQAAIESLQSGETFYSHNLGLPALREAVAQAMAAKHPGASGSAPIGAERIAITSGGVNALMLAVQAVLLEFASFTNQALVGMNLGGPSGRDWIVSNAAAMEAISIDITPVDAVHVVVAARFTNALGEIAPIPPCIGGFGEFCFIASLYAFFP